MRTEYWTTRYSPERVPPVPLKLAPPLKLAWKHKPRGAAPGFLRAGFGAVFTTAGKGHAARIDTVSGRAIWAEEKGASLIARWRSELLTYGYDGRLRSLDPSSGRINWEHECEAGVDTSFVVGDVLAGNRSGHFHAFDLKTRSFLWKVPESTATALVSDGNVLIRADEDVTCFDLQTGAVRWNRSGSEFGGKAYQTGFVWRDLFAVRIGEPLLLTALEIATGKTAWRADFPVQGYQPYADRVYGVEATGVYRAVELATGKTAFTIKLADVPEAGSSKKGLMVSRPAGSWPWRGSAIAMSETHAFVSKPSGQIVVLRRETGEIEQTLEIDGMPAVSEPIIYENRLLVTDFNAGVYCFEGS